MGAGPTALYRLFNEWGDLLYIGTTVDPAARWKDHRKRMPWWYQVDHSRTRIEWLECGHVAALRPEREAITAELPWYNRAVYQFNDDGTEVWPNLPPGCPPQPWYTHRPKAEYRPVWREWFVIFRDCMLNPEERSALGRLA
jgi:predicted GIY-YIG superfamily endonuclease